MLCAQGQCHLRVFGLFLFIALSSESSFVHRTSLALNSALLLLNAARLPRACAPATLPRGSDLSAPCQAPLLLSQDSISGASTPSITNSSSSSPSWNPSLNPAEPLSSTRLVPLGSMSMERVTHQHIILTISTWSTGTHTRLIK